MNCILCVIYLNVFYQERGREWSLHFSLLWITINLLLIFSNYLHRLLRCVNLPKYIKKLSNVLPFGVKNKKATHVTSAYR